jgi:hypothetical protein
VKLSLAALALGIPSLAIGIFLVRGGDVSRLAFTVGLVLLTLAVVRLVRLGRRGTPWAWEIAALPAAILTWTIYELVRQSPPYPPIGVLGTSTAPVLSLAVAFACLTMGWLRRSPAA